MPEHLDLASEIASPGPGVTQPAKGEMKPSLCQRRRQSSRMRGQLSLPGHGVGSLIVTISPTLHLIAALRSMCSDTILNPEAILIDYIERSIQHQ